MTRNLLAYNAPYFKLVCGLTNFLTLKTSLALQTIPIVKINGQPKALEIGVTMVDDFFPLKY